MRAFQTTKKVIKTAVFVVKTAIFMELVTRLEQATFSLRVVFFPFFIVSQIVESSSHSMTFRFTCVVSFWLPEMLFCNFGSQMVAKNIIPQRRYLQSSWQPDNPPRIHYTFHPAT